MTGDSMHFAYTVAMWLGALSFAGLIALIVYDEIVRRWGDS
jgi:hypothetical protein